MKKKGRVNSLAHLGPGPGIEADVEGGEEQGGDGGGVLIHICKRKGARLAEEAEPARNGRQTSRPPVQDHLMIIITIIIIHKPIFRSGKGVVAGAQAVA